MSTLREQLAHDLTHGDMSHNEGEETALDRIGALARTDPLGAALWRLMAAMDAPTLIEARRLLALRLHTGKFVTIGEYPVMYRDVAQAALQAWMGRADEKEAADILGKTCAMQPVPAIRGIFVKAVELIEEADARVERQLGYQLGHRAPSKPLRRKAKPRSA